MTDRPLWREPSSRLLQAALAVAASALAGCGSDPATSSPAPTPVTTRAFVYLLDHTPRDVRGPWTPNLAMFGVDPRTGLLHAQPTPPVVLPQVSCCSSLFTARTLAADPHGRFLYVAASSRDARGTLQRVVQGYRVEAVTGALTLVAEVPFGLPYTSTLVYTVAATATHLYVGGGVPRNTHGDYTDTLQVFTVDPGGPSMLPSFSLREGGFAEGYHSLLAVDAERGVFYTNQWGCCAAPDGPLVAAVPDPGRREGYREVAAVDEQVYSPSEALAADGLFFNASGDLSSLALTETTPGLVRRASVSMGGARPVAHVRGFLATGAAWESVGGSSVSRGVNLYQVGAGGELALRSALPSGTFAEVEALALHPSGHFLYVAAVLPDRAPALDLLTYSIGADGNLRLSGSVPYAADGSSGVDQMVVVTPPS